MGRYDDIIDLESPTSKVHPPMPRAERAKQFSPFAALKGYDKAIEEKSRYLERRRDIGDWGRTRLDESIVRLGSLVGSGCEIEAKVLVFVPETGLEMGNYEEKKGWVTRVDIEGRTLTVAGERIPLASVDEISFNDPNSADSC